MQKTKDTKSKILKVAEGLIAENGIENTTISSIAKKTGVADSLLYQHFSGKTDLLFTVAKGKIQDTLEMIEERFQGIIGSKSKLSRLIWSGLRYNDKNWAFVKILLFECRSNLEFYSSPAYELLKTHSKVISNIIREGIKNGSFRNDINIRLVRDIYYGTLDFEAISCVATGETQESVKDFDDIIALILPMITRKDRSKDESKKSMILNAAEHIFSENAFAKATISDVARQAHVGEGSIYDYFKNKDDLLFSVAEKHFQEHLDVLSHVFKIDTPVEKLQHLIRSHFTLYATRQQFSKVFVTQILYNRKFYDSKAYGPLKKYFVFLETLIQEGKKEGSFRKDVNPRVFRNMYFGAFAHMAIRWIFMGNGKKYDKAAEVDQIVDLLTRAVCTPDAQ